MTHPRSPEPWPADPFPLRVALSVGCPCGIGPEVTVAALDAMARENALGPARLVDVYGDRGSLEDAARTRRIDLAALEARGVRIVPASSLAPEDRAPGKPGIAAGRAQLDAIDRALDSVLQGTAGAMVTGPASKRAITLTGASFIGHTEHLQQRTNTPRVVMSFVGPKLRTALVTTHHAIAELPSLISVEAVRDTLDIFARALVRDFRIARPHVAVTGLNPHAGEGGLFGREEIERIAPAVREAQALAGDRAKYTGPLAAEAAFRMARDGRFDAVLAMYHDQATIASKLLDFGDAVNVTLGMPVARTSVDHGTGYDVAGQGKADERGMRAALELGFEMAERRAPTATRP